LALALRDRKPEIMALLSREDAEVHWRFAAFRAALPTRGPIWPPRIRNTARCDTLGCCGLCGDELPKSSGLRFPRCQSCIHALWLALNTVREGVGAS
jgi:hypothetical protein